MGAIAAAPGETFHVHLFWRAQVGPAARMYDLPTGQRLPASVGVPPTSLSIVVRSIQVE